MCETFLSPPRGADSPFPWSALIARCPATRRAWRRGKRRGTMHKISLGRTAVRFGAVLLMASGVGAVDASSSFAGGSATITNQPWGTTTGGEAVDLYTLTNNGIKIKILTYGGILQRIHIPARHRHVTNVALGFDNLADYQAKSPYFGALI